MNDDRTAPAEAPSPMPELPEVETLRRSLEPRLLGRTIAATTLHRRDVLVVPGDPPGGFPRNTRAGSAPPRPRRAGPAHLLEGATLDQLRRHGKQLALVARDGRALVVQLGMTGTLRWLAPRGRTARPDHVHARWTLDDGSRLLFRDPRRFGGLVAMPGPTDLAARWAALGPDALDVTPEALHAALHAAHRPIKAALLDQAVLAGVGNIYADEALFAARLHPAETAAHLTIAQTARLADAIRGVLHAALDAGGSTLRDYADAAGTPGRHQFQHAVYGRAGEACRVCGLALAGGRLAQRATVWCPRCQPEPNPLMASQPANGGY